MKRYDEDDTIVLYAAVYKDGGITYIRAWSDNKDLVQAYLDFHKCKRFKMKSLTGVVKDLMNIINENIHDEVNMFNIKIHDKQNKIKMISVPMTETEFNTIQSERVHYFQSHIDYHAINTAFYFLKNKYQRALSGILLEDAMKSVCHDKTSELLKRIKFDEFLILVRSFPDYFGV